MAVLIGGLVARCVVTDDAHLNLSGAYGVHALEVDGQSFVYAAGYTDNGLSGFEVGSDGMLTTVAAAGGGGLGGAVGLASATVGGATFLFASGLAANRVCTFLVGSDGALSFVAEVADTPDLALSSPAEMAVAQAGDASFLVAAGMDENGFSVFRIGADGTLSNTDNLFDATGTSLVTPWDVVAATVDGHSFVFVAGLNSGSIQAFELDAEGRATFRAPVYDTDDPALRIAGPMGLAVAEVGGTTFLVAAGFADDGLGVFAVGADGSLTSRCNLSDTDGPGLDGASAVTAFLLEGETFVAACSQNDGAVGIYHLGADGVLSDLSTLFDDAGLALAAALGSAFVGGSGTPFLVAGSYGDNGLSSLEIGGGADKLSAGAGADLLLGFRGEDVLDGGAGADRLVGGLGRDLYLVDDAGDTVIEAAGGGHDRVSARTTVALAAEIEDLRLLGTEAIGGTGNTLANRMLGNAGANPLKGGGGGDRLFGGAGADTLAGGSGNDRLCGGTGGDTVGGGTGADTFILAAAGESRAGSPDLVSGFARGSDVIDLGGVDANVMQVGNQAFRLDADGSFSAGEIRQRSVDGLFVVEMNLDRDLSAEMAIRIQGLTGGPLGAADFVL